MNHQGRTEGTAAARGCSVSLCILLSINQVHSHLHIQSLFLKPGHKEGESPGSDLRAHSTGSRSYLQTPPIESQGAKFKQSRFPEVMEEGEEDREEVKRPMCPPLSTINPPALNLGEW